jgi:hypothetical protein
MKFRVLRLARMPMREPDIFGTLEARCQRALLGFLVVDLNLVFTFLQNVRIQDERKPDSYEGVRTALESIRRLQRRIENPEAWEAIQNRANHLEAELKKLASTAP